MVKVLRSRATARILLVGALLGLGICIYIVQPPAPLCTIVSSNTECFLAQNRKLVLVDLTNVDIGGRDWAEPESSENPVATGPLIRVWDIHKDIEVARFIDQKQKFGRQRFSPSGAKFAVEVLDVNRSDKAAPIQAKTLIVLDIISSRLTEADLHDTTQRCSYLHFSEEENLLARLSDKKVGDNEYHQTLCVYDLASGRLLMRRESPGPLRILEFKDEFLLIEVAAGKTKRVETWNPQEGVCTGALTDTVWNIHFANWLNLSKWHGVMATRPKSSDEKTQEWVIWDPFSRQITGQFKSRSQSAPTEVGDYLVFQCDDADGSHLELRAKNTGRLVSRTPARPFWLSLGSPDGRYLAMEETKNRFAMVEIPGWQALWTIAEDVHSMAYSNDSNTVFVHLVESHELNAYDCKTGRRRFELRLPRASRMDELVNVRTTADRKTVVIMHKHGIPQPGKASYFTRLREWLSSLIGEASDKHDITVVVDADSCRERLRVVGYDTSNFTFSEDGQTLVTVSQPEGHQDCTIRCWDVDGWKPLLWPVGIPIGLGACVQVLCWWTCRGTIKQSDPPAEKPA